MIYAAIVRGQGQTAGTWKVAPQYTRVDGTDALEIEAFSLNGLRAGNRRYRILRGGD